MNCGIIAVASCGHNIEHNGLVFEHCLKAGLWELCSKFLSLFYSEFLLKSLHYAQFYSFHAYDFIIILHLKSKLLIIFSYIATYLKYNTQNLSSHSTTSLSVSCLLSYSFLITSPSSFTTSSTVPELEMSLFCYFSNLFLFLTILFILTFYAQYFAQSFNMLLKV